MKRLLRFLRGLLPRRIPCRRPIYGRNPRTGLLVIVEHENTTRWSWK